MPSASGAAIVRRTAAYREPTFPPMPKMPDSTSVDANSTNAPPTAA